jgi:ribokinase
MVTRETATGICLVLSNSAARNAIVWRLADELLLTPEGIKAAEPAFHDADAVLVTFEVPLTTVAEVITTARRSGAPVILNAAPALQPTITGQIPWDGVDVLVVNEAEAMALLSTKNSDRTGAADLLPRHLSEHLAISTACVTLAHQGCATYHDGQIVTYRADEVHAVDSTGAGDTFVAVLSYHLSTGAPIDGSVRHAMIAAASTVRRAGSYDSLP